MDKAVLDHFAEFRAFKARSRDTAASTGSSARTRSAWTQIYVQAKRYAAERVNARLVLIDGATLARLMVRYNIGVQDQETYLLKRINET